MRHGIPIHSSRRAAERDARAIYSVRLARLGYGQPLKVSGTAAPSYCSPGDIHHARRGWPCGRLSGRRHSRPHYPVRIKALVYRARTSGDAAGAAVATLPGGTDSNSCTLARHHCPLLARSSFTPARGGGGRLNMALIAWTPSRKWRPGDRLTLDCTHVGGACDNSPRNSGRPGRPGRVLQAGELAVLRPGEARHERAESTRIDDAALAVNRKNYRERTVVHSVRLDGIEAGDVITARGEVEISGHGFDHYAGSYWVLATGPEEMIAESGGPERYMSSRNGVNCLGVRRRLTGTSSGYCSNRRTPPTLPVRQDANGRVPAGAPSTMYLNYVVFASDGSRPKGVTPSAEVGSGRFRVDCRSTRGEAQARPCSIAVP